MISVSAENLSYSVGITPILTDISFSIEEKDRLSIVGVNGSGKSTLLKILAGELEQDKGAVRIAGDMRIGLLHQNDAFNISKEVPSDVLSQMYAAFPHLLSLEKEIKETEELLRVNPSDAVSLSARLERLNKEYSDKGGLYFRSRCRSVLLSLGFDEKYHSLDITEMSGGQRTKLALARLLASEPDILMLDEPTNHLDSDTTEWLEDYLAGYRHTLIIVSHDRFFLDRTANKTLDIENTKSRFYACPYSEFTERKKKIKEVEQRHYDNQQREIARIEGIIENQRKWNRERNIIAAESREKALERMEKLEKPEEVRNSVSFRIESPVRSGNDVLRAEGLAASYPGNTLFSSLSFLLKQGERLFITGPNGCGKSTLVRILTGNQKPSEGFYEYGYNVKVGYFSQENSFISESSTVFEELSGTYPELTNREIRSALARFMFREDDIDKPLCVLSGGEKSRLTLAKLYLSKVNLLVLDEPTNHLDISSTEALEEAVQNFDGTVIAVSHDRYFVRKLATRYIEISKDGCIPYEGTYEDFRAYVKNRKASSAGAGPAKENSSAKDGWLKRKADSANRRKLENRLNKIASESRDAEKEIEEIDTKLAGEAAYDYKAAAELTERKEELEELLLSLYEEEETIKETLDENGGEAL